MNDSKSSMILIGIGGAGSAAARGVSRAFGPGLRYVLADTDAATGAEGEPFVLLGGDRLAGRGSGGDIPMARLAAEDSRDAIDETLDGARLAVVVACLGGGTGTGATLAVARHLRERGIPSIVFATIPFEFEGAGRRQNATGIMSSIATEASSSIFLPLDRLVAGEDNMESAMKRAVDTLASGITLFWRMVERPGYIRLDPERVRRIVANAEGGRFAVATAQGPDRAAEVVDALSRSPLLAAGNTPARSILCGILAGEDLRLSEVGRVAEGVKAAFGRSANFDLATVNDEATFSGRLSVVVFLFESGIRKDDDVSGGSADAPRLRRQRRPRNPLAQGPQGRGRFNNVEPTINDSGVDLDTPTYLRQGVTLDA